MLREVLTLCSNDTSAGPEAVSRSQRSSPPPQPTPQIPQSHKEKSLGGLPLSTSSRLPGQAVIPSLHINDINTLHVDEQYQVADG